VTGVQGVPLTGEVEFILYDTFTCEEPALQDPFDTVSVSGTTYFETVESKTLRVETAGSVAFKAVYNRDDLTDNNYPEAWSGCEAFTVSQVESSVNTAVIKGNIPGIPVTNSAIDIGEDPAPVVRDKAVVMGFFTDLDPTGTVDFYRYPNADCTGTPVPELGVALIDDSSEDGIATAYSSPITLTSEAFYCWQVFYSGDLIYDPSQSSIGEPICAFEFDPVLE
jgi:hypothetical protein